MKKPKIMTNSLWKKMTPKQRSVYITISKVIRDEIKCCHGGIKPMQRNTIAHNSGYVAAILLHPKHIRKETSWEKTRELSS